MCSDSKQPQNYIILDNYFNFIIDEWLQMCGLNQKNILPIEILHKFLFTLWMGGFSGSKQLHGS